MLHLASWCGKYGGWGGASKGRRDGYWIELQDGPVAGSSSVTAQNAFYTEVEEDVTVSGDAKGDDVVW